MSAPRLAIILGALAFCAAPAAAQERPGTTVKPGAAAQPQAVAKRKGPVEELLHRGANPKGPFARLSLTQRDSIVAEARELLGVRYRWAGLNPATGLDCSGIVKYVFAKLGIDLPHDAAAMARMGGAVTRDTADMQPGDLLMYGRGAAITHVAIYVGDGMMVHASSMSRQVVERPVAANRQLGNLQLKGVRRVIALDSTSVEGGIEPPPE